MQQHRLKRLSRRQILFWLGAAGFGTLVSKIALAGPEEAAARINQISEGKEINEALIMLDLPEID